MTAPKHQENMNQAQITAFWIWYKSANGDGHRSMVKTAERCGVARATVSNWHKDFNWEELAQEKDLQFGKSLEQEVEAEIIDDFKLAQQRQRKMIGRIYAKFQAAIDKIPASSLKLADLIKLMEFEAQYGFPGEGVNATQGNMLAAVLQAMSSPQRTEFNATVERLRDAGQLRFDPVGSAGRN